MPQVGSSPKPSIFGRVAYVNGKPPGVSRSRNLGASLTSTGNPRGFALAQLGASLTSTGNPRGFRARATWWWHGWLVRKALASHQCDPGSNPAKAIMWVELCVGSLLCHEGFSPGPPVFPPSGKIRHFRSQAVLRGHNGLMWLAAKGALACLLLEHVVAASFAIQLQLRVRMISLPNYYYLDGFLVWEASDGEHNISSCSGWLFNSGEKVMPLSNPRWPVWQCNY